MRITSGETRLVAVPRDYDPVSLMPPGVSNIILTLQLRTDDGLEGIAICGYTAEPMMGALKVALDTVIEHVIGHDPLQTSVLPSLVRKLSADSPGGLVNRAVSAIDVACWDLRGKAFGQSVASLLGAARDRVPTYASGRLWPSYSLDELAAAAPRIADQGFTILKMHMGRDDTEQSALDRFRAVRDNADIRLMVDCNQQWHTKQAIEIGLALADEGLYWLEDPIHYQDFEGMAAIAAAIPVPLTAGEYHYGLAPFRDLLALRGIDIAMVDMFRSGGITGFMKVAALAETYNAPVVSHLATEYLAHPMAALPHGMLLDHVTWSFPLYETPPELETGELILPTGPGFGLRFDEAALARMAV